MDIKSILSKPLPVIWYRFVQLLKLIFYFRTKFWKKKESKVFNEISTSVGCWKQKSQLFSEITQVSYKTDIREATLKKANEILEGTITIFDVPYMFSYPLKWHEDWRFKHNWKKSYYRNYSFYEKDKTVPYDVKFPWELSRLSFLIPVARAYLIEKNQKYIDYIYGVLLSWKKNNPLAYSVNWYAMEASVRSINLIQLREIILLSKANDKIINLLNGLLLLHGIFLWRNIEYTDVRGNHYSANLTALLLLGVTFTGFYKESEKWFNYAIKKSEKEFHLQFIDDGVNFEKSIAYHRLVVEFYLISFLVIQRLHIKLESKTLQKFKYACTFIKDYTKPDNTAPIFGDNDSASIFQNDGISLFNHTNILQLVSIFLDESTLNLSNKIFSSSIELFGIDKISSSLSNSNFTKHAYLKGGFAMVKKVKNYFITDVGEVGMKGKGGHGHNDLFSFELFLDNQNLIVDPGCYTYTGNLDLKKIMRSSAYHNGLTIDDKEIAPLIGEWNISDIARPYAIKIDDNEQTFSITGKHAGYERIEHLLEHKRKFNINKTNFSLTCIDTISCTDMHYITRYLHFAENVSIEINENIVIVTKNNQQYLITFDEYSELKISDYILSYNYGTKIKSQKLSIYTAINKSSILCFLIERKKNYE